MVEATFAFHSTACVHLCVLRTDDGLFIQIFFCYSCVCALLCVCVWWAQEREKRGINKSESRGRETEPRYDEMNAREKQFRPTRWLL